MGETLKTDPHLQLYILSRLFSAAVKYVKIV